MQKKKMSPLPLDQKIDFKDIELLKNFITEYGKILPRRATGVTVQQQRKITKTITERHYIDTRIATYFHCASLKYLLTRLNPVLHPSHTQFIVWTGPWTGPQHRRKR